MGVGDEGGRGRSRSYTAVRRECWCRRWGEEIVEVGGSVEGGSTGGIYRGSSVVFTDGFRVCGGR